MINNLFEAGKLFNLLRGYIIQYNFIIKPGQKIDWTKLESIKDHPLVDQFFMKKSDKIIKLMKTHTVLLITQTKENQVSYLILYMKI